MEILDGIEQRMEKGRQTMEINFSNLMSQSVYDPIVLAPEQPEALFVMCAISSAFLLLISRWNRE